MLNQAHRFLEPLPEGCPPPHAVAIDQPIVVYRLVGTDPPTMCDFRSHRCKFPNKRFRDECTASGLSVFTMPNGARKNLRRSGSEVWEFVLNAGDGYIMRDENSSHCTWWPFDSWSGLNSGQAV